MKFDSNQDRIHALLIGLALLVSVVEGWKAVKLAYGPQISNEKLQAVKPFKTSWLRAEEPFRDLAGEVTESQCFMEQRLNTSVLKREIAEMEARQNAGKRRLTGIWNGLDLSRFPVSQAKLLQQGEKWLEVSDPALIRICKDIYCIFDVIYGSKQSEAGLRIYHWFLKMGYVIAASSKVPYYLPTAEQIAQGASIDPYEVALREEKLPLEDHLFTPQELGAFSVLSGVLSPGFQSLWSLQSFHRLPSSLSLGPDIAADYHLNWQIFNEWDENRRTGAVTNFRRSYRDIRGEIRVLSRYIKLSSPLNPKKDDLFVVLSHEIAHALDRVLHSPKASEIDYTSVQSRWMGLSGWSKYTFTEADGASYFSWRIDPGREKFISDYAETSPKEDFAESVAHYRLNPEGMLRLPGKSKFIADKIYHGRYFDAESLKNFYLSQVVSEARGLLPKLTQECEAESTCLKQKLALSFETTFRQLKRTEMEACSLLDQRTQAALIEEAEEMLAPRIQELSEKVMAVSGIRQKIADYQEALRMQLDPREIYLSCYSLPSEEMKPCYDSRITHEMDLLQTVNESWLKDVKEEYLEKATFELVRLRVETEVDQMLIGSERRLREKIEALWSRCRDAKTPESAWSDDAILRPFSGGETYVELGILNCINQSLVAEIHGAFIEHVNRPELGGSPLLPLVSDRLMPQVLSWLKGLLARDAEIEASAWSARRSIVTEKVLNELLGPAVQLTPDVLNELALHCEDRAQEAVRKLLLSDAQEAGLEWRFSSSENMKANWGREVCDQLRSKWSGEQKMIEEKLSGAVLERWDATWAEGAQSEADLQVKFDEQARISFEATLSSLVKAENPVPALPKSFTEAIYQNWKKRKWDALGPVVVECWKDLCRGYSVQFVESRKTYRGIIEKIELRTASEELFWYQLRLQKIWSGSQKKYVPTDLRKWTTIAPKKI